MAKISVRYLTIRPGADGGLPRYFWQPSGKLRALGHQLQRLPANWRSFTDPAALEAAAIAAAQTLNAALDGRLASTPAEPPAPVPGLRTLGQLIDLYVGSDDLPASAEFVGLAPSTQKGYRQCLVKLLAWGGDAPVRAIDAPRVQKLAAGLAATPAYANAVIRVLRLLLAFGRRAGWVAINEAERPNLANVEPSGLIWPRAAVLAFAAAADAMGRPSMGDAVLLNEWLGQRQGDIRRMPRSVYRNGSLVLRQNKTGAGVILPIDMVAHLKTRLEQALARTGRMNPQPITIIVSEETERPYEIDNFGHVFARVRASAAETHPVFEVDHLMPGRDMAAPDAFQVRMLDLTFMHLRHTAVTRLAEGGCDAELIASVSGHAMSSVHQILERYMVRTRTMAVRAFQKRLDAETLNAPAEQLS